MSEQKINADVASRRHLLKLGALAAPAVITLAPGTARAATSVLCHVPFPQKGVDEDGKPCEGDWGGKGDWDGGYNSATSDPLEQTATTQGGGFGGGRGGGRGGGGGKDDKDRKVCYSPEGGILTSEQISNGFGIDGIGGGSMKEYKAYVSYLNRVKSKKLAGASCLMSLDMTGR